MASDKSSQLMHDLKYAYDHRLLENVEGQAIHQAISCGVSDPFVIDYLRGKISKHQTAQLFAGPFRQVPTTHGEIVLGLDLKQKPVRMAAQTLCAHSLTLGGSGSGKTTKSRWSILQAALHVAGLWLFDFRKREYRCLVPWLASLGMELTVLPARELKLNPLEVPPHVDPFSWATRLADMLVHVCRLPVRASKLLNITLLELFDRFGIGQGCQLNPTMFDLREAIATNTKANAQSRSAIVDSFDPILMSLRSVLSYRRGWTTKDLAKHRIVFELDGIGEIEKDLILSSLLLPEFTARVAAGVSNRRMNLWICCDEAARLVSASGTGNGIGDLVGLIRGTGIGLDLSIQNADIAPAILSNTASKFIGRCGSAADYNTLAEAMGLVAEQRRYLAQTLVPGMFVGQMGEGSWRYPFVFRVPAVDLSKPPTAAQMAQVFAWRNLVPGSVVPDGYKSCTGSENQGLSALDSLPTQCAYEFVNWTPSCAPSQRRQVVNSTTTKATPSVGTKAHNRPTVASSLSEPERKLLRAIIDHPGKPSSAYAKLAGVGTHQAIAARRSLIAAGYLRQHSVNTSVKGRVSIVLEPLPAGLEALQH